MRRIVDRLMEELYEKVCAMRQNSDEGDSVARALLSDLHDLCSITFHDLELLTKDVQQLKADMAWCREVQVADLRDALEEARRLLEDRAHRYCEMTHKDGVPPEHKRSWQELRWRDKHRANLLLHLLRYFDPPQPAHGGNRHA